MCIFTHNAISVFLVGMKRAFLVVGFVCGSIDTVSCAVWALFVGLMYAWCILG